MLRAARRRLLARGLATQASAGSQRNVLAALIERIPVVTPPLPEWKRESLELRERIAEHFSKVYPQSLTTAEEGPDRKQARLRAAAIIEDEASREGEGDRTGDESSMDRKLAHRLYLALRTGDSWTLPQVEWAPGSPAVSERLGARVAEACGDAMVVHWVGNAPVAHLPIENGATFYWRLQHVSGTVEVGDGIDGFAWLTKHELAERLAGPEGDLALEVCGPFD